MCNYYWCIAFTVLTGVKVVTLPLRLGGPAGVVRRKRAYLTGPCPHSMVTRPAIGETKHVLPIHEVAGKEWSENM